MARPKEVILADLYSARDALRETRIKTQEAQADLRDFASAYGYTDVLNQSLAESYRIREQRLREAVANLADELHDVLTAPEYVEQQEIGQERRAVPFFPLTSMFQPK